MSKKAEGFSLRFVLINTGNISRKVLSKVLRSFVKNFERLQAEIAFSHTNIVRLEKNGQVIFSKEMEADSAASTDRTLLNLKDIYEFAQTVKIDEIKDLIDRQLAYNMSIAKEGLTKSYGANVGATILKYYGDDVLYVPTNQLDSVRKYVGGDEGGLKVNKLGTKEWLNTKAKVKKNLRQVAKELIELYAKREKSKEK